MRGPIMLQGFELYFDDVDSLQLTRRGTHEPRIGSLLNRIVSPTDTVVDIGAMIGYFTVLMAKKAGLVYAIEPEPGNFRILEANVQHNGLTNVSLHNCALLDRLGRANLYYNDQNHGDHRMFSTGGKAVEVPTTTLDDLLPPISVDVIKSDTQGAELAVLKGAVSVIERSSDLKLILEFAPWWLKGFGTRPKDLLKFLRGYFDLFSLAGKPVDDGALLKKYPPDRQRFTTLFCVRRK